MFCDLQNYISDLVHGDSSLFIYYNFESKVCEKITKYTKIEKKLIRNKTKLQFFKYVTLIITLESQKNCLENFFHFELDKRTINWKFTKSYPIDVQANSDNLYI